jgi:hypothetical protein
MCVMEKRMDRLYQWIEIVEERVRRMVMEELTFGTGKVSLREELRMESIMDSQCFNDFTEICSRLLSSFI